MHRPLPLILPPIAARRELTHSASIEIRNRWAWDSFAGSVSIRRATAAAHRGAAKRT
jgi:hypothetical protein